MKSIINKIEENSKNIIEDNNFLFAAFQNRLTIRMEHIFERYRIPINKNMLSKKMEENLINTLMDYNAEIIEKYVKLVANYEKIIQDYVKKNTDTAIIKKATMEFVNKVANKNSTIISSKVSANFIEYVNSIIFVYDNYNLTSEIIDRINGDTVEILKEFNRNNYNFVIESINIVIKNIINNM